ncbi:MAG TPA: hypothetical protein VLY45_07425 [Nitrospiria bacterium]|nr:hypothetical protein [Nitrospiria bacterium]
MTFPRLMHSNGCRIAALIGCDLSRRNGARRGWNEPVGRPDRLRRRGAV